MLNINSGANCAQIESENARIIQSYSLAKIMSEELWRLDARAIAAGIRKREFTVREAVASCLARLDEVNPRLNAITEMRPDEALAVAEAADQAVQAGRSLGELHGVPVTIKGNVDVAGWATPNGCAALAQNVAPTSSPCVQNWLDAGAIVIGRTNTPEFSVRWETNNDYFGATVNPWHADITPGGSSGGAAASIAAGITSLASGTDLGGSLRHPAQACGVASLRPGRERVPDFNPTDPAEVGIGFQLMNVNGPIARRIKDVRLGFVAMAAGDRRDPWWSPVPADYSSEAERRVALVLDPAGDVTHPQVRSGVERAGRLLVDAGYAVEENAPAGIAEAAHIWRVVCLTELLTQLEPAVRDICGPQLRKTFECYRAVLPEYSLETFGQALAKRRAVLRDWLEFFQQYSLIVAPVGTEPPLPRNEDIATPERTVEIVETFRMIVAVNALGLPAATVPVGVAEGLPQVVQIIGPPFAEMRCLAAAEAIEAGVDPLTPIEPR